MLVGSVLPGSTLADEAQQPRVRKEPISFHFTQDRYSFDPAAIDTLVSLAVTNHTDATLVITHLGEHPTMLAELHSPITLAPGASTDVNYVVKSRMLPPTGILSAAIGITHDGHMDVISQHVPYGLLGFPLADPSGVSWRNGEKASPKTIKLTLAKGQKLVGIKVFGGSSRFHTRVDANDNSITIWPESTEQKCYSGFSLMTDPQLDSRFQITVCAAVN